MTFQQSDWNNLQKITPKDMNTFSNDIYDKLGVLTGNKLPVILYVDGVISIDNAGNVNLPSGVFRFTNASYSFLPANVAIFGSANATIVPTSGVGYIVARYSVLPTTTGQTNYQFPTSYIFVSNINQQTDCMICSIANNAITGMGCFYIKSLIDNLNLQNLTMVTKSRTNPGYTVTVFNGDIPVSKAGTLVTNGTVSGSNLSELDTSLESDFVRVSNYSQADANSYVNAGIATYINQGGLLYPIFSNDAFLPNNHTVIVSSLADSQGAGGLELLCDNAMNQAGVIVNYDHPNFSWSRPKLAGDLSLQTRTDPNSISVTGDFRNKLLFIDPLQRYFLLINAYRGSSNRWYCTLSGFVKVIALSTPNDSRYEVTLDLNLYFGVTGIAPNLPSLGTVNRYLPNPLNESSAIGNFVYPIVTQDIILVGLQFDRTQTTQGMDTSFVCQFTCTTIGNF